MARLAASALLVTSIMLVFWSLGVSFTAETPFRAARPMVAEASAISIYFLVFGTVTRQRLHTYLSALCLPLAATCLISLLALFVPQLREVIYGESDRAFGFFKNPNQFGIALGTLLPVVIAMCFIGQRRQLLWWLAFALLALGLLASGSKANILLAIVTVPFCFLLFTALSYSGSKRWISVISMAGGICTAGLILIVSAEFINPRAAHLLGDLFFEGTELQSVASRKTIWADSWENFLAHPLFGVGGGQFTDIWESGSRVPHSHNLFLESARTLGIPGLILVSVQVFVVLVISTSSIRSSCRTSPSQLGDRFLCIGLAACPLAYIGANMSSDSMGPTTSPFFFATVFLGFAARRLLHH